MKISPVTTVDQAKGVRTKPILAIDLGFAFESKTCGLSSCAKPLTFAEATQKTSAWIGENHQSKAMVLIIEAPLSSAFNKGNPIPRGGFETHHSKGGLNRRHWHHNAGGAMSLAALYFLRQLSSDCGAIDATLLLVEGFVSRYEKPKPSHTQVAKALASSWKSTSRKLLIPNVGDGGISVLELLDRNSDQGAPIIVWLPDGYTKLTIG